MHKSPPYLLSIVYKKKPVSIKQKKSSLFTLGAALSHLIIETV